LVEHRQQTNFQFYSMESALSEQTRIYFNAWKQTGNTFYLNSKGCLLSETTIIYLPRRAQQRSVLVFTLNLWTKIIVNLHHFCSMELSESLNDYRNGEPRRSLLGAKSFVKTFAISAFGRGCLRCSLSLSRRIRPEVSYSCAVVRVKSLLFNFSYCDAHEGTGSM
jgi:hypothetical protein